MIITTSLDEAEALVQRAKDLAIKLDIPYYARHKKTIHWLQTHVDSELFVVNKSRGLSYYHENDAEVFYHPNMASLRIKQLQNQQLDGFITACQLKEGMTFLDCTLGLASDALVALYQVGKTGQVIGVEKSFPLSVIVKEGLTQYLEKELTLAPLQSNLTLINDDNLTYLKTLPDNSVDVIYFDFMFEKTVESSAGIGVIKPLVAYDQLTKEHVEQAKRVARNRIVVKSSHKNAMVEALGFEVSKQNKKRHFMFGVIALNEM